MKGFDKKVGLVVMLLFVALICNVYATNSRNNFKSIKSFDEVSTIDVNVVVRQYVPSKYVKAFNLATICGDDAIATANMRLQILAIGYYESGWTKTICDKPNRDGSVDIGYLQLNSKNIKNEWFMKKFGPNYETSDELECYLVTCINFYKALYSLYGEDAVYAYNAGETRYLKYKSGKLSLPNSTFTYKKWVSKYTKVIFNEMRQVRVNREKTIVRFKNQVKSLRQYCEVAPSEIKTTFNEQLRKRTVSKVASNSKFDTKIRLFKMRHSLKIAAMVNKKRKHIGTILLDSGISTKRLSGAV